MEMKTTPKLILAGALAAIGITMIGASAIAHMPGRTQNMPGGMHGMSGGTHDKERHVERLERMKAMDTNKDGMLSQSEIYNGRSTRFAVMDTDKDGKVSAEEIDAIHKAKRLERINRKLAMMDTDGDGSVSLEEFARFRGVKFFMASRHGMMSGMGELDINRIEKMHLRHHQPDRHHMSGYHHMSNDDHDDDHHDEHHRNRDKDDND